MNRIITIGREFGSGGRELALKLAEKLQIAYYDREIITEIAKKTSLAEQYVQQVQFLSECRSAPGAEFVHLPGAVPDHKRDGGEIGLHSCGTLRGLHSPE